MELEELVVVVGRAFRRFGDDLVNVAGARPRPTGTRPRDPNEPDSGRPRSDASARSTRDDRIEGLYKSGWDVGQISAEVDTSNSRVEQVLRRHGHKPSRTWTGSYDELRVSPYSTHRERDAEIVAAVRGGAAISEVARRYGLTSARVYGIERDARHYHPPTK